MGGIEYNDAIKVIELSLIKLVHLIAFHIKNSIFIIYLLEDEQELSLGMLDTSPTYL